MRIIGQVTKKDIFRFQRCTKKRRPKKEKNALASAGAGAVIYMAAAIFMRQYRTAVLILCAVASILFLQLYLMQKSAKESGILGPISVFIDSDALEYHAGIVRTRVAYQNIRELVQTKQGDIYLYTGRLQGYILPGSLFASESERTEVLEDLKEKIETAGKSHEE